MFDWEHRISLHAMQWNRASSLGEVEVSWFFLSSTGTWGIFLSYGRDDTSKLLFVQRCQDTCLGSRDTSDISSRLGRAIRILPKERRENQGPFLVATVILGFLSIFNRSQA